MKQANVQGSRGPRGDLKGIRLYICIFSVIFFSLLFPYSSHANSLDNWVAVTLPSDNWFYGMTYGNGTFVTVGAFGTILTSPDGVAWTSQTSRHTHHLYGAGFGNNTFVAVGTVGSILTSWDNGVTWTLRNSRVFEELYGVAYGNGKFVVVGANGKICTSSDNGITWVDPFWAHFTPTNNWLFGAAYGNSTFVSVGAYGTVLTSSDAISWSRETSGTSLHLMSVAYGNGTFVAVGESGTILSSIDGVNWSPQTSGITDWLRGIAFANGYFVAVGDAGTILTSPDGMNWAPPLYSDNSYDLEAVAYDTNQSAFAAVGGYGIIMLDGDLTVNATFTAGIPKISVTPTSSNFGSLKAGSTSSPKTVTVKNTGKGSLIIDSISITGADPNDFSQTNSCTVIFPSGSCTISVTFNPTSLFGKKTAIMSILSTDTKKPTINVQLLGQDPSPTITVSTTSVNVGSVAVGNTSTPKVITIRNTGISDLTVNAITITGTNATEFGQTNACSTVAKGSSCAITVTLSPTSTGSESALMSIYSNDPKKPIIKLSGKGSA
jgi:photosystem II stability/assembly factor-like uncharacterized protein